MQKSIPQLQVKCCILIFDLKGIPHHQRKLLSITAKKFKPLLYELKMISYLISYSADKITLHFR